MKFKGELAPETTEEVMVPIKKIRVKSTKKPTEMAKNKVLKAKKPRKLVRHIHPTLEPDTPPFEDKPVQSKKTRIPRKTAVKKRVIPRKPRIKTIPEQLQEPLLEHPHIVDQTPLQYIPNDNTLEKPSPHEAKLPDNNLIPHEAEPEINTHSEGSDEQEVAESPLLTTTLPTYNEVKEQYRDSSTKDLENLNEALLTHSLTLNDIDTELVRAREKHTKFKRLADEVFTRNNYIENDDSYNLRQHAVHYSEHIEKLEIMKEEELGIKSFLEEKIEAIKTAKTPEELNPPFHTEHSDHLPEDKLTSEEKNLLKQTILQRITNLGKLFLKFSSPKKPLPPHPEQKSIVDESSKAA